jgi:hypothetical protein
MTIFDKALRNSQGLSNNAIGGEQKPPRAYAIYP